MIHHFTNIGNNDRDVYSLRYEMARGLEEWGRFDSQFTELVLKEVYTQLYTKLFLKRTFRYVLGFTKLKICKY